nr:asparagine synthase (glutamine-hydrolyzing) [Lysobacter ruishenii]
MCGLVGFIQRGADGDGLGPMVQKMADRIRHRGPDDGGSWCDPCAGIALGHRRLAIIELSDAGHQPMVSASGRWVIAYNGEIYNHRDIRRALDAEEAPPCWRGGSDTETILAAIEAWGVEGMLSRSIGMFAFALWDRQERALWLARDRMGEKPLYYGWQGNAFLFGSELKALAMHPAFSDEVDRGALALMLRHTYVPSPYSIYAGISKLPPGSFLCLRDGAREVEPVRYWSLAEVAESGASHPYAGSPHDAMDLLEQRLDTAVRRQMMSDVPLGALLSGGIDSTIIVAMMQAHSSQPVRTFTIGFDEEMFDEAPHARHVAGRLGTDHSELLMSAKDALSLIPHLPEIYNEPFADSSQLPTHLVMRLARSQVKVALSGDGGDELFGGYSHYLNYPMVWRRRYSMPLMVRRMIGAGIEFLPVGAINLASRSLGRFSGGELLGDKVRTVGARLREFENFDDLYVAQRRVWGDAAGVVIGSSIPENIFDNRSRWPEIRERASRMMAMDGLIYLPDCILVKVDRAAMAVSLETRAPFLDKEVVELAWSLPEGFKLHAGQEKWLLRRLLERYLPDPLVDRRKQGFSVPLDQWLRGPLREWAEGLIATDRLHREGFFDPTLIATAWRRHVEGQANLANQLWSVLMFQAWSETRASWKTGEKVMSFG